MPATSTSPQLQKMFGVPVRWAGLVMAATLGLICFSFVLLLWTARVAEREKASVAASNLSAALTQDIARSIELYDLSIKGVIAGLENPIVSGAQPALRQMLLFDRAATAPYLGSLVVLDEHGSVLADSASVTPRSINYADRAYFKAQASRNDLGLYVSEPFEGRFDHDWIIALSRRIDKPDGSFGGVVAGTLRLEYLHRLFGRMRLGPGDSLTLFRTDGTVIMREPYDPAVLGKRLKPLHLFDRLADSREGEYEARAVIDGIDRLYHYQRVADLPLVQNVAISVDAIYADWWRKTLEVVAIMATSYIVIITLAVVLRSEFARRLRAEAALVALAAEDSLTGLANRRRFDAVLDEEWRRAVRCGSELSLLMIDADHFKLYNDSLGHLAGDHALVALASCLTKRTQRAGDLAARYGGEEFAIVLGQTGAEDALRLGEAIRRDVAGLGLPSPGSAHRRLTVSVGIATVTPGVGDQVRDLIQTADTALYMSKAAGRNRSTLLCSLTERTADPAPASDERLPTFPMQDQPFKKLA